MFKKTALIVLGAVSFTGCGWSVSGAREAAAQHTCNWYNSCKDIGTSGNKSYATMDDCLVKERSNWLSAWPTTDCEGHINSSNLDVCLKAIDGTACGNILDALSTAQKCGKSNVCNQ